MCKIAVLVSISQTQIAFCIATNKDREICHSHHFLVVLEYEMLSKRGRIELCEVDDTFVCEHIFAHVDVLDVREDERAVVLTCDWMGDIYGFVELLGGIMTTNNPLIEAGGVPIAVAFAFSTNGSLMMFMVNPWLSFKFMIVFEAAQSGVVACETIGG
ncbi:hypothetical protein F4604DRAFT_1687553 [Suillus subluteus]|nr:hypothetical protein F4604DRAFT_1687551 [Suillus subluteus]KAG1849021.1 hypothetical protein F4604DRAFT_1687553 [Suillus subluteus]